MPARDPGEVREDELPWWSHDSAPRSSDPPLSDVLEGPPPMFRRLRAIWSRLPRLWRVVVATATIVAVGLTTVLFGVTRVGEWLIEQGVRDEVAIEAAIEVSSSSSSPAGGRVDYYVVIRNAGPRPVRIDGVEIVDAGFQITNKRALRQQDLQPGGLLFAALSVHLDCARSDVVAEQDVLSGLIAVRPTSGRWRRVEAPFTQAAPLVNMAATMCALNPDLRSGELSGPVL